MPAIVGLDAANGDLGVAVESKTLAAGATTPWARAGVGAIATLGIENMASIYGQRGLDLLASGKAPEEVVQNLTSADARASWRQVAVVDANGRTATFTGADHSASTASTGRLTGGLIGPNVVVVGGGLIGEGTLRLMIDTFERTPGALWERLMSALRAGRQMGGDTSRETGQHSAALLVVRQGGGYGGFSDRLIDLRVDDDPDGRPVEKLQRLLGTHAEYFLPSEPGDLISVDKELARELQTRLARSGDYHGWITGNYDAATRAALEKFATRENLEERLQPDERIDYRVLARLGVPELWWWQASINRGLARRR
jgi:uncharacterized Ntn-hydrolase superfamily protein